MSPKRNAASSSSANKRARTKMLPPPPPPPPPPPRPHSDTEDDDSSSESDEEEEQQHPGSKPFQELAERKDNEESSDEKDDSNSDSDSDTDDDDDEAAEKGSGMPSVEVGGDGKRAAASAAAASVLTKEKLMNPEMEEQQHLSEKLWTKGVGEFVNCDRFAEAIACEDYVIELARNRFDWKEEFTRSRIQAMEVSKRSGLEQRWKDMMAREAIDKLIRNRVETDWLQALCRVDP